MPHAKTIKGDFSVLSMNQLKPFKPIKEKTKTAQTQRPNGVNKIFVMACDRHLKLLNLHLGYTTTSCIYIRVLLICPFFNFGK